MGIFKRDPAKKEAREIKKHMNKIRKGGRRIGSDGLIYNEDTGQVEYDKNRDERTNGGIPPGTPPYNPNPNP